MRDVDSSAYHVVRWATAEKVRVGDLRGGDRFVDPLGLAWVYRGAGKAQLLRRGRPVVGVFGRFSARAWVVLRVRARA